MVGPSRPQFVLFGSSIVQLSFSNGGWGANLTDIYARKADIVLRGYSGWNSRRALTVLDKVFPKNASVQPSLVIVYFGGNDSMGPHPSGLSPHVPLSEYVENMRKIANHIKGLSDTIRIIFLGAPPVNETVIEEFKRSNPLLKDLIRTNELCGKYSEALVDMCREMKLKVIDIWSAIQKREDWLTTCFTQVSLSNMKDGVHLSAEGSKIVTEEIMKVLKEANWEPSLHWMSMPTEFSEDSPYDPVSADGTHTLNPSEWVFHRKTQVE